MNNSQKVLLPMLPHGNGFAPRGSVAVLSPSLKSYCKKASWRACFCNFLITPLDQSFAFICWKQVQHFDTLTEMKCSFSRIKVVIPTFPSTCFQKHKSQKINYSIHHSLPGTWMAISWGPVTRDALCSYKTLSKLKILKGCNETTTTNRTENSGRLLTPHRHHCAGNGVRTQSNNCLCKMHSLPVKTAMGCTLVNRKHFQKQKIYFSMHFFLQVSRHISLRSAPRNGTKFG